MRFLSLLLATSIESSSATVDIIAGTKAANAPEGPTVAITAVTTAQPVESSSLQSTSASDSSDPISILPIIANDTTGVVPTLDILPPLPTVIPPGSSNCSPLLQNAMNQACQSLCWTIEGCTRDPFYSGSVCQLDQEVPTCSNININENNMLCYKPHDKECQKNNSKPVPCNGDFYDTVSNLGFRVGPYCGVDEQSRYQFYLDVFMTNPKEHKGQFSLSAYNMKLGESFATGPIAFSHEAVENTTSFNVIFNQTTEVDALAQWLGNSTSNYSLSIQWDSAWNSVNFGLKYADNKTEGLSFVASMCMVMYNAFDKPAVPAGGMIESLIDSFSSLLGIGSGNSETATVDGEAITEGKLPFDATNFHQYSFRAPSP